MDYIKRGQGCSFGREVGKCLDQVRIEDAAGIARATREHGLYFLLLRTVCEEIKKVFFVWRFSSFRREDQLADVSLILEALSNTKIGFNNALTMHVYLRRAKLGIYLVCWTQMT